MKAILPAMFLASAPAMIAQVEVTLPAGSDLKQVTVEHCLISDLATAKRGQVKIVSDTVAVNDNKTSFELDPDGAARYLIPMGDRAAVDFYAAPGEKLNVDVKSTDPLDYTVTGSANMEAIMEMSEKASPIVVEYRNAVSNGTSSDEELKALLESYDKVFTDFITANPATDAAGYALNQLDGEKFLQYYDNIASTIESSMFYPMIAVKYQKEKKKHDLMSGNMDAPDFTLKNLEGENVSLSQFRGKWVVLDFWGSWCIWCIKGFPSLKEAYNNYAGKVEVIGIDCNEPEDKWRAGVEKYQLPWVNVYNPTSDSTLLEQYSVQGFPTKVVVNPEGKIVNITTGEDPTFFNTLDSLINK